MNMTPRAVKKQHFPQHLLGNLLALKCDMMKNLRFMSCSLPCHVHLQPQLSLWYLFNFFNPPAKFEDEKMKGRN